MDTGQAKMRILKRILLISALLAGLLVILLIATGLWFVSRYSPEDAGWSYSTVVLAKDGSLLGATTARDGMWRFPPLRDSIPNKIEIATLVQEDKRFYRHFGVDPIAIARAMYVNVKAGKVKQGGSTITMQLARILMGNQPRTFFQKLKEILLAIGLELKYSKKEILLWYLSLAPYGGNIVGVEAASWRYFGKPLNHLTWAESATLAVLPHSPSLINLRKNRELLEKKRNRLLYKIFKNGYIDSNEYALSIKEPIPVYKHRLPTHLIQMFPRLRRMVDSQTKIRTTINPFVQKKVEDIVLTHYQTNLLPSDVHNIAVVVVDLRSGEVVAAVPNVPLDTSQTIASQWVDMLHAERNPGSALKPVLYASALTDGIILPSSLLPDYPISVAGYAPRNFSGGFRGAVPAWKALAHSLNVPAVVLLHRYGVEKYHFVLRKLGLSSIK
ncbi:MAG: penicillin-binding protein 1C, partial [Chlorobi bacterium]|nr:penicillin-binding protein 1C [Chlorobiota bacterium]